MSMPRVLLVDDQQDNLDLMSLMLRSQGYEVLQATHGTAALQLVRAAPPDIILLDVVMPGLSGLDVTAEICSDPALPFIPIIMITAQRDLDHKVDGLDAGADDFLSKPVQLRELLAKVRALLRLKQAQDALIAERNKTNFLYQIQQQLTSTLDIHEVVSQTVRLMVGAVGATQGSIIVLDGHGSVWLKVLARPETSPPDDATDAAVLDIGLGGRAIRTREAQLVTDAAADPRWLPLPDEVPAVRSAVAVPLYAADATLGVLTLTHPAPAHFTAADVDLLTTAASQISIALRNAALYTLLREAEAGREQFLHMLTHDLRGPLAGIAGCLHMLQQAPLDGDDRLFVEMAQMACVTSGAADRRYA